MSLGTASLESLRAVEARDGSAVDRRAWEKGRDCGSGWRRRGSLCGSEQGGRLVGCVVAWETGRGPNRKRAVLSHGGKPAKVFQHLICRGLCTRRGIG